MKKKATKGNLGRGIGGAAKQPSTGLARRGMTGSVATDIARFPNVDTKALVRAAAMAEKTEAGTVLRIQYMLEEAIRVGQLRALDPNALGDGRKGYAAIARNAYAVVFKSDSHLSRQGATEIVSITALTPPERKVELRTGKSGRPEIVPTDGSKMLEIFTSDPLMYVEGPWWSVLDADVKAIRADLDVALAPDRNVALRNREERERNKQEFQEQFARDHGA